ncbi:MAG TPA: hypothetical protein VFS24_19960 [Steroidobacteraceae bacterium]|nr:hypothetical protein [Steroidobacteraceae bacterium]
MKMLPVSFDRQVLPGTFEYTLNYLIDEKIDLSVFEARYKNDENGAPHMTAMDGGNAGNAGAILSTIPRSC